MPEKSKRRKNNKNKRKNNKNNRPDENKNASDASEIENVEPRINNESDKLTPILNVENSSDITTTTHNDSNETNPISNPSNNFPSTSQDLNNNATELNNEIVCTNTNDGSKLEDNIEDLHSYVVESPDQSIKSKPRLGNSLKSKSLDNDDTTKITEITEEMSVQSEDEIKLSLINTTEAIISDVESDVEWEKIDDIGEENKLQSNEVTVDSVTTTTTQLNMAKCDETKSLSPEEEMSLRRYLQSLNLATNPENSVEIRAEIEHIINHEIKHRLRKKGTNEDCFPQKLYPPRVLHVIDEEGSSESSLTSRRQSYLSDKRSDNEDLDDEVFEEKKQPKEKYCTKSIKPVQTMGRLIPQQCVLVGAKIKDPEITEARGDWTMKTVEKMSGAELVYLTDSSSSTSSIHDMHEETDEGVETDASVRIITPTIEVTDTENLLKNSFIDKNKYNKCGSLISEVESAPYDKNAKENSNKEYIIKIEHEENVKSPICDNTNEMSHEIVILSTDNIQTNLYVKDLNDINNSNSCKQNNTVDGEPQMKNPSKNECNEYDIEMKVLKCELNSAINNLIKEVVSDSETANENTNTTYTRQDSSSSVGSSQCTAKYNPNYSSLNDVSNILHDETLETKQPEPESMVTFGKSHVKDVFERITESSGQNNFSLETAISQPTSLRDSCVKKIAQFPYGETILEELAHVSERLQNINIQGLKEMNVETQQIVKGKQNYENVPLPDVSSTANISSLTQYKDSVPPPIQPRHSSLKKSHDEQVIAGDHVKAEPNYVCLSPSQKMLMEKTNTVLTKDYVPPLTDVTKQHIDRRDNDKHLDKEKLNHENIGYISPAAPFKSQTGSRLLALIRNPTVNFNVNAHENQQYKSVDQIQKKSSYNDSLKQNNNQLIYHKKPSDMFKPIPPPRPRKYSSSFYESDESSDFTDNMFHSLKSERKIFHHSTGNLTKATEHDISSIQNLHRRYSNTRDQIDINCPRRPSLPKELCDQQMEYIRQKEKEVDAEIRRLEEKKSHAYKSGPRAPLISDDGIVDEKFTDYSNYNIRRTKETSYNTHRTNVSKDMKNEKAKVSSLFSSSQEEILRDKMYSEYISQMEERQRRKEHKVIKITNTPVSISSSKLFSKSMSALDILDSKVNNRIEKEFICRARERWDKLGIKDPETEDERETAKDFYREPKIIEHKIKVIDGGQEKDVQKLPNHLQEFVRFTAKNKEQETGSTGESETGPASPHVVIWCAVMILIIAIGKYFLRLLKNK